VLLAVHAHHEAGDVDDLLAHADVALADEHARVVDALGQALVGFRSARGVWGAQCVARCVCVCARAQSATQWRRWGRLQWCWRATHCRSVPRATRQRTCLNTSVCRRRSRKSWGDSAST
jgi:hypothetical protein